MSKLRQDSSSTSSTPAARESPYGDYEAGEYIRDLAQLETQERNRCDNFTSKAVAAGVPLKVVSEVFGHASVARCAGSDNDHEAQSCKQQY